MEFEQDIIKALRTPFTECYVPIEHGERVIWLPPKNDAFKIPGIGRLAKPMVRMISLYEINTATDEVMNEQSFPLPHIKKAVAAFLNGIAIEAVEARQYNLSLSE